MAIAVGGKKGLMAQMNVVPLIDILLVLLIIFMVITPTTPVGLSADVPQPAESGQETPPENVVVVWIGRDGQLRINREETDWSQLGTQLEEIFKRRAHKVAFVASDPEVQFQEVARVIDVMRGAGIVHVGLLPGSFEEQLKGPERAGSHPPAGHARASQPPVHVANWHAG